MELDVGAFEEFKAWWVKASLWSMFVRIGLRIGYMGWYQLLGMAKRSRSLKLLPRVSVRAGNSRAGSLSKKMPMVKLGEEEKSGWSERTSLLDPYFASMQCLRAIPRTQLYSGSCSRFLQYSKDEARTRSNREWSTVHPGSVICGLMQP
jgi:hypothetical protein